MAQEQAKSTGAAAPESKDERPNPLEAMMKSIITKMAGDVGRSVHNPTEIFDSTDLTQALKILFTLDKSS